MKKVLLDTNIVLDIALERQEFKTQAENVTRLLYESNIPMFITATTVTDIYYLIRKLIECGDVWKNSETMER